MEHLLHPFIPGTPENMAIMALWPALMPLLQQILVVLTSWRHAPLATRLLTRRQTTCACPAEHQEDSHDVR
jgi:hypothetical protein